MIDDILPDGGPPQKPITIRVTPDELANATKVPAKQLYVIYSAKHNSILHDPITQKPVFSTDPKHLEDAAKVFQGVILTHHQAYQKLTGQA